MINHTFSTTKEYAKCRPLLGSKLTSNKNKFMHSISVQPCFTVFVTFFFYVFTNFQNLPNNISWQTKFVKTLRLKINLKK